MTFVDPQRLDVYVMDCGHGEAILTRFRDGRVSLAINVGSVGVSLLPSDGQRLALAKALVDSVKK